MHYFTRNIGDYHKKAGRLSMLEHGAYTLLMDACYDREEFPTLEDALCWCWARSDEEVAAVKFVLAKFFTLEDGRYTQRRITDEIEAYRERAEKNKRVAREREATRRANKEKKPAPVVNDSCTSGDDSSTKRHLTNNQEPITKNQEPEDQKLSNDSPPPDPLDGYRALPEDGQGQPPKPAPKPKRPDKSEQPDPDFDHAWTLYPKRAGGNPKRDALRCWHARRAEGVSAEALLAGVKRYAQFCEAEGKVGTIYVLQAVTFFGISRRFEEDWTPSRRTAPAPVNRQQQLEDANQRVVEEIAAREAARRRSETGELFDDREFISTGEPIIEGEFIREI